MAAPVRRLPGRGGPGRRARRWSCAFDLRPGRAEAARLPDARPGHTEMSWLRELTMRRRAASATARREAERSRRRTADRARAGDDRAARTSPATSWSSTTSSTFCRDSDILCQGRGSAANSAVCYALRHHQRRRGAATSCSSSGSSPRSGTGRPTSTWTSSPTGGRRSSSTSTSKYGRDARRPGRQRHHLPAADRRCGTWPRRSATRPGQQDAWCKQIDRWGPLTDTVDHDIPEEVVELANELHALPAPPRHPLRRHGDLRPAGGRGVPGGVGAGCRAAPCCSGTRTTARRRAGEVRPARARHALGAALRDRPDPQHHGLEVDLGHAAAGRRRGLRHALPGRLGRRVPGGEPGADGDPAPAEAAEVLRPGGRGGADPARPDPGRLGAPVHPAQATAWSR